MSLLQPRWWQLFLFDMVATAITIVLAFAIRFEPNDLAASVSPYMPVALLPLAVNPVTYAAYGLYRREWGYASLRELAAIAAAVLTATAITAVVTILLANLAVAGAVGFPRSVFAIEALLGVALIGGGRFLLRGPIDTSIGVLEYWSSLRITSSYHNSRSQLSCTPIASRTRAAARTLRSTAARGVAADDDQYATHTPTGFYRQSRKTLLGFGFTWFPSPWVHCASGLCC